MNDIGRYIITITVMENDIKIINGRLIDFITTCEAQAIINDKTGVCRKIYSSEGKNLVVGAELREIAMKRFLISTDEYLDPPTKTIFISPIILHIINKYDDGINFICSGGVSFLFTKK